MLVFIKLTEFIGIISKYLVCYAEHNNTKYYFIHHIEMQYQHKGKRTHQAIQQT